MPIKKYLLFPLMTIVVLLIITEIFLQITGILIIQPQNKLNKIESKDKDAFRILTLGESTTADWFGGGTGEKASWPRQLEHKLKEKGHHVRVYNEGIPGTSTPFILKNLQSNIDKYKPHLIIAMMGVNDNENLTFKLKERIPILNKLKIYKILNWSEDVIPSISADKTKNSISNYLRYIKIVEVLKKNSEQGLLLFEKDLSENGKLPAAKLNELIWEIYHFEKTDQNMTITSKIAQKALELYPDDKVLLYNYLNVLKLTDQNEKCLNIAITYLKQGDNLSGPIYTTLGQCLARVGKLYATYLNQIEDLSKAFQIKVIPEGYHHRLLTQIALDQNIKLIFMQYPTLSTKSVENFFQDENIKHKLHFISNEKNFNEYLKSHPYSEVFKDNFRESWGHTTLIGDSLIVDNILSYFEKNKVIN